VLVELLRRERADRRVQARHDAQELLLAREVGEALVRELAIHQDEIRCLVADHRWIPRRMNRVPSQGDDRHDSVSPFLPTPSRAAAPAIRISPLLSNWHAP